MTCRDNKGYVRHAVTWFIKLAAAALCVAILCACSSLSFPGGGVNDLLRAPILNQRQADLDEALSATLNLSDIVYRYPQKGENRTPFIFYDLDGDGKDEAVVFYSLAARALEIRAKVLCQDDADKWYSFCDIPGQGDQVDFVEFASLVSSELPSVLIGWQDTSRRENQLEIYTMDRDTGFTKEASHKYTAYSIVDYGGRELSQIVLVSRESRSSPFELRMLGGQNGHVRQIASFALYNEVSSILQMKRGRLWDGTIGIFIDEVLENDTVATEIARVYPDSLSVVAGAANGEDTPEWGHYISTFRPDKVLSADINDDDQIEIPSTEVMPGEEETDEASPLTLTVYRRMAQDGFQVACTAAVNNIDGYLVFYPDRWLERVGVINYPESGQWRFFRIDEKTLLPAAELLRVSAQSYRDYDGQGADGSVLLGARGTVRYYGYIPAAHDEQLAITPDELKGMFKLL